MPPVINSVWRFFIAVNIFILPIVGFTQKIKSDASASYRKGLASESLDEKIEFLRQALEHEPEHTDALYQLAISLYQSGEYQEACEILQSLIGTDSTNRKRARLYLRNSYVFYAEELLAQNQFQAALENINQSVKLDSLFPATQKILGDIRCAQQEWKSCRESYEKSLALDSNQDMLWNELGNLYFKDEDYIDAIEAFKKALALNPVLKDAGFHLNAAERRNSPGIYLRKFETALNQGHLNEAVTILEKAGNYFSDNKNLHSKLSSAKQTRSYFEALSAIEKSNWKLAFDLLQTVDPEYRDTAFKLEEVRAELLLSEDSLLTRKASIGIAIEENTSPPLPEVAFKSPSFATDVIVDTLRTGEFVHESIDTTGMMINPNSQASGIENQMVSNQEIQPAGLFRIAVVLASAFILILGMFALFYRGKKSQGRTSKKITPYQSQPRTDEFILDKLASETPVAFDPAEPRGISGKHRRNDDAENGEPNDNSFEETRTIPGGIQKAKRVGRYFLEKEIGRGAMGRVYKAWDPMLDRIVVIKQVSFDLNSHTSEVKRLRERLYREARAAGKLNHPNIVIIYDVEEDRKLSYIVMEYVEGQNLQELLDKNGAFELSRTLEIIQQVCSALDFSHAHEIIHRDIKPSNILLASENKIKVADFGIAQLPSFGTLTQTGNVVGTPFYMSPEQIEGRKLDGRTDIFSLGVVLYEMLTGIRPFRGDNLPAVIYKIVHKIPPQPTIEAPHLPAEIDRIIAKALAKDAEDRYSSVAELEYELRMLARELTVQ